MKWKIWSLVCVLLSALLCVSAKQDCVPGDWSSWSVCSESCGATGSRQRDRKIQALPTTDGKQCSEFEFKQIEACNRICYNGGSLGNTECNCRSGWTGPCCQTDINECANANAGCAQKCVNIDGGFRCECYEGFAMNTQGNCEDVDECSEANKYGGCQGTCMNYPGGYACGCIPPKFLEMDKKTCADKNYCLTNAAAFNCSHHCVVHNNAFKCECPDGFKIDDLYNCIDEDECNDPDFCSNGDCTNTEGKAYCDCGVGRGLDPAGKTCIDVDECKAGIINQCSHICQNVNAGHVCLCPAGLEIGPDHKTCQDENECERDPSPCSHSCTNQEGSYFCTCPETMELEYDNRTCCEIGKCIRPISKEGNSDKKQNLIITFSVVAVVIVLVLVVVVWRTLRRTISSNEKVMRAIRHGDVPDVYYNRNAEIEMESRGMGLASTASKAEPYSTFQRRNVLPKSFSIDDEDSSGYQNSKNL